MKTRLKTTFLLSFFSLFYISCLFANENGNHQTQVMQNSALIDEEIAKHFFEDFVSIEANFVQSSVNPINSQLQYFVGRLYLNKLANQNQFRFEYQPPNQQLIVANGTYIWMVDYDLEQVLRYFQKEFEMPISKLLINPEFELIQTKSVNQSILHYFRVVSDDEQQLVLLFKNRKLSRLIAEDSLGNLVSFELDNIVKNQKLDANLFQYTNPNEFELIEL